MILITAVLPAEYGIDPTRVGRRLGLATLSEGASTKPPTITATESGEPLSLPTVSALNAVWKAPAAYRTDELTLTLKPVEGAEIKADMKTGDRFMVTWTVEGGAVTFDMHGENLTPLATTSAATGRAALRRGPRRVPGTVFRHAWLGCLG